MSYSSVDLYDQGLTVLVTARGGTRRQRGTAIASAVRGKGWTLVSRTYSETYGFQSGTYATYRKGQ